MASTYKGGVQRALDLVRVLPRVALNNIKDSMLKKNSKRGRGQHGGKTQGCGQKGSKQRQNYMRVGYETGNNPFYLRIPMEHYYKGHHLRKEYPHVSLVMLQTMIDTGRLNPNEPIDVTSFCNTKLLRISPMQRQFGYQLTLDGVDNFKTKVNLEMQWATEAGIAAVERTGGVITTAYYDLESLLVAMNPGIFFRQGKPIPRRLLPPQNLVRYYTDPKFRGYLADPEEVAKERVRLAQKYGYTLPDIDADPQRDMLLMRKDPRQLFYGLEPGWVVNMKDKVILKPLDPELREYYRS